MAAAIRRFISRYLAGKRDTVDIDESKDLYFELTRQDLWEYRIGKEEDLEMQVYEKLNDFKLKVKHAYSLYRLICEDDEKEIENELQIRKKVEANKNENKNLDA